MTEFFHADDGLRLAYDVRGSGPDILCLAGLSRNMADFDFVARDFADRARIIRMDYRGRGQSDHDDNHANYNLQREGQDALALLDHLGLARAAILGTSRGGLIGMGLGAMARDRVSGVCLNDIGPVIEPAGLSFIMGYLGVVPDFADYDAAADHLVKTTADTWPDVPRARWLEHAKRLYAHGPSGLTLRYDPKLRDAVIAQSATGDIADFWPVFDALAGLPLALIRGARSDLLSAETAAEMRRRRPDMIFADVPNRGHVPFLDEAPARRVIAQFIDLLP